MQRPKITEKRATIWGSAFKIEVRKIKYKKISNDSVLFEGFECANRIYNNIGNLIESCLALLPHGHLINLNENRQMSKTRRSLCSTRPQTANTSSFHPSSVEKLMRGQSHIRPHHHFLPQPLTYLSALIEFARTQSASLSLFLSIPILFCNCQKFPNKT